jgi:hypothetical protein
MSAVAVRLASMRRRSLHATAVAVIVAVLSALSVSTALARTGPGNAIVTRDYLQLELARTRAEVKGLPVAFAAIDALPERLKSECPGVLADEPEPTARTKPSSSEVAIVEEVDASVFVAAEQTEYPLHLAFAHSVSRLAWSDGSLTRLVHSSAADELAKTQMPAPDLCADLRAWVASGYQTVSAAADSYDRRESTLSNETESAEAAIKRKLARDGDEDAADKRIARQIAGIEKRSERTAVPKVRAAIAEIGEVLHDPAS